MTVYDIGYQRHTPDSLADVVRHLGALVVDVRSVPSSRKRGFSRMALMHAFGDSYVWKGDVLGGRGAGPTPEGLEWVVRESASRTLLLMCLEEAAGDCHRHHTISVPLLARGVDVRSIYRGELVTTSELARAMRDGDDYAFDPFMCASP